MTDTTRQSQREILDDLAFRMATATDAGDLTTARRILHQLEASVGIVDDADDPAPVLARRFARAHREALRLHDQANIRITQGPMQRQPAIPELHRRVPFTSLGRTQRVDAQKAERVG